MIKSVSVEIGQLNVLKIEIILLSVLLTWLIKAIFVTRFLMVRKQKQLSLKNVLVYAGAFVIFVHINYTNLWSYKLLTYYLNKIHQYASIIIIILIKRLRNHYINLINTQKREKSTISTIITNPVSKYNT